MKFKTLNITNKFVKKTLSFSAWLATKVNEDSVNSSKIFQNALIEYLYIWKNFSISNFYQLEVKFPPVRLKS